MRVRALAAVAVATVALGCGSPGREGQGSATPPPGATPAAALTESDLRAYVAVRGRALQKVEEALAADEARGPRSAAALPDLGEAEREAAAALGVEYRRYLWARDRTARVLAMQRQAEDRRRLVAELARTQSDLLGQIGQTSDAASREFLEAQVRSLETQIASLRREQHDGHGVEAEAALVAAMRVDLAVLHSREERLQERLRQLVRRAGEGGAGKTRGTPGSP